MAFSRIGWITSFYNAVVFNLFLNPEFCFKPLFVPGQLDIHIASAVLQLILNGNDGLTPVTD